MLQPGLPSPCMAERHTITRAHWMPVWLRQAPPCPLPQPPRPRYTPFLPPSPPRPADAGLVAAGAAVAVAPAAGGEIAALAPPFPREPANVSRRDAGFLFLPLRRFCNAVFLAEQIGFPHVEADGVESLSARRGR